MPTTKERVGGAREGALKKVMEPGSPERLPKSSVGLPTIE